MPPPPHELFFVFESGGPDSFLSFFDHLLTHSWKVRGEVKMENYTYVAI